MDNLNHQPSTDNMPLSLRIWRWRKCASDETRFHWRGRRNGVSRYVGSRTGPPVWLTRMFAVLGAGMTVLACALFVEGGLRHGLGPGLEAILFTCLALWTTVLRRRIATMVDVDEAARRLNLEPDEVKLLLQQEGTRPRMNINGEDLYDLSDLGDAGVLLRPAASATDGDSLLRAAQGTSSTGTAGLLRAAQTHEDSEGFVVSETSEPPVEQSLRGH